MKLILGGVVFIVGGGLGVFGFFVVVGVLVALVVFVVFLLGVVAGLGLLH